MLSHFHSADADTSSGGWSRRKLRFCECLRHTDPRQEQELARRTPRGGMKLLLTSAGIKNTSIHDALVDLLGKPIDQSNALCIPTATYAFPGGAAGAWRLINGRAASPLCEL